ncbi:MAG: hypothetical protein ABJG47_15390 [Ekhidna sp.]
MRRGQLLFLIGVCACASLKTGSIQMNGDEYKAVDLDFENCAMGKSYKFIEVMVPVEFKLSKHDNDGFCEYRFAYKNEAIFYVSSNTFSGSMLNYENRLKNHISTYSTNRSENDTIRNNGREMNGKYWLEWINGGYAIGYFNADDSLKFEETLASIKLSN